MPLARVCGLGYNCRAHGRPVRENLRVDQEFHYPPDLFANLEEAIALLFRGKEGVVLFSSVARGTAEAD